MTAPDYESKIAALLTKAEDPAATPEEAETYTAKAEALMVKWGISDAQLDAKRKKSKKAGEKIVTETVVVKGSWARGLIHIAFGVGHGLGNVRVLKSSVHGSTMDQRVYFIGHESDVLRAMTLFESLQLQALSARAAWWKDFADKAWMTANEKFLAKRQFIMSFGAGVESRLTETRRSVEAEQVQEAPGTELVLVSRQEAVDNYMGQKFPRVGKGRATNGGMAGHREGHRAGREANMGGTQVGTGSAGALK